MQDNMRQNHKDSSNKDYKPKIESFNTTNSVEKILNYERYFS